MSTKHTQAPWLVDFGDDQRSSEIWAGEMIIADVHSHVTGTASHADATLIAAAPDLLNACQLALAAHENGANIDWRTLNRAIAKATGASMAAKLPIGSKAQHHRDSAELRSLCQERDEARKQRDLCKVEIAGLNSSVGHLSAMVDGQTRLVQKAVQAMKALHETAKPDDGPDMNAIIPAAAFHVFVDVHAELMFALKHGPQIAQPPATDKEQADRDLTLFGQSFMVDGKRVSPERVQIGIGPRKGESS